LGVTGAESGKGQTTRALRLASAPARGLR